MNDKAYLEEFEFKTNVKLEKGERELDCSAVMGKEDLEQTIDLKDIEEQLMAQDTKGDQDAR